MPAGSRPQSQRSAALLTLSEIGLLDTDSDGDGVPDPSDCRPADNTLWSIPSPAVDLTITGDALATLQWSAPAQPGGTTVFYDLLMSGSKANWSAASCLAENTTITTAADGSTPGPGQVLYYLVRAKNACGQNMGTDSAGNPRSGAGCAPFPKPDGEPCSVDAECSSGFCTDGFCCAERCNAECASCSQPGLEGSCEPWAEGTDPEDDCDADDPNSAPCGYTGLCAGAAGNCQMQPPGTVCSEPYCATATSSESAWTCDGRGGCESTGVVDCAPYICDDGSGTCLTACSTADECEPGHTCFFAWHACLGNDGHPCASGSECYGMACCNNTCTNLSYDENNCGACGVPCSPPHATGNCLGAACTIAGCEARYGDCNGTVPDGCETYLRTTTDCLTCGTGCDPPNSTGTCDDAGCHIASCDYPFANCNVTESDGCEVWLRTTSNCNGCGIVCDPPNSTGTCSTGTCAIQSCDYPYGNCNGSVPDGCETWLRTTTNCNGCGLVCDPNNATGNCSTGSCAVGSCDYSWANCNGSPYDGCETNVQTPQNSCGGGDAGSHCGDTRCGFPCADTSWTQFSSRSWYGSVWYYAYADECSSCSADVYARVTLVSPADADYDLEVYRPCGTLYAGSYNGTGQTDQVTIYNTEHALVDDSFYYYVYVKWYSGNTCSYWQLKFEGMTCQ